MSLFSISLTQVPWSEHCDSLPASKGVQNEDGDDHGHWSMTMKLVKEVMINKGIRDAGSTADIRMLWPWSALVCLGLL